jgi:hypothetical protein
MTMIEAPNHLKKRCARGLCVLVVAAAMAEPAAAAVSIRAHRAVYDLSLLRSEQNSNISGADGRMVMEITGSACEGWSTNFRRVMELRPNEGDVRFYDNQVASWESGDGLSLELSDKQFVNNRLESDTRIKAVLDGKGAAGSGTIETPFKEFSLPAGTLFPMAHQIHVMSEAEKSAGRDVSLLFDGGSGAKTFKVISFIGKRKDGEGDKAINKALADIPSWPLTISFFELTDEPATGESLPAYQLSFPLYENGVAGELTLDYGDYVMSGKLTSLELLQQEDCK